MNNIPRVQPYGDLKTASILIIGHDPLLQKSDAHAGKAFFFEYLEKDSPPPTNKSEARKYGLARAVCDYVKDLAGRPIPLDQLYVTNLCNEYLERPETHGIVLIPEEQAERGLKEIRAIIPQAKFRLILPMSLQTFYHLCHLGFLDEANERISRFIKEAQPSRRKADQGVYFSRGEAPFLEVCGGLYHHRGIPLVPVMHVKQWPLKGRAIRYNEPMELAKRAVREALTLP
jgi:hypothetical protein